MKMLNQQECHEYTLEVFDYPTVRTLDRMYGTVDPEWMDKILDKARKHFVWTRANYVPELCDCNYWAVQFVAYVQRQWVNNYFVGNFITKCKPMVAVWQYTTDDGVEHMAVTYTVADADGSLQQRFIEPEVLLNSKVSSREVKSCSWVEYL